MASLTKESGKRKGWRLRFYLNKKRRSLWLGNISKRIADGIAYNVDRLAQAKEAGQRPDAAAVKWADSLDGRIRDTLAGWGLVDPVAQRLKEDSGNKLAAFLENYIDGRTDIGRGALLNYKQSKKLLVEFFKADRSLTSITPADADRWRRWLLARVVKAATETAPAKTMAEATVSKNVKRAKTMLAEAVRDRLIESSPFAELKGGSESNKSRQFFVDRATTAAVLKACPDHEWKLIFALARYAGMRCPSEVTALKWSDILWDLDRLRIDSSKTGLRFCPIFPELKPILEAAFDAAPDRSVYCVGRYGGQKDANLGTHMKRITTLAGHKAWPKTFVNLRSTRRTELQERFPSHVVDEWLGHSTAVAEKHYLQVTPDHWTAGANVLTGEIEIGGPTGGPIGAHQGESGENDSTKKPREKRGMIGGAGVEIPPPIVPGGLEPPIVCL